MKWDIVYGTKVPAPERWRFFRSLRTDGNEKHFSMRVEPARPRKPKDKPKAEQGVQAIQRYILVHFRHQKIFSVDEANKVCP
jgi:hypothetical protein